MLLARPENTLLTQQRRAELIGEFLGTAFLVIAVVGSGIAAQRLTPEPGVQLLINSFATAGALVAFIAAFASISAARFNPAVTLMAVLQRKLTPSRAVAEIAAQVAGGLVGVVAANVMFGVSTELAVKDRSAGRLVFAEVLATIGLLVVIDLTARRNPPIVIAVCVAGYIAGAYFFTSSTSFANPAVTTARMFTDTYTGISPASALRFIPAQLAGAVVATVISAHTKSEAEPDRTRSVVGSLES